MELMEARDFARKFYNENGLSGQKYIIVEYDVRKNKYEGLITDNFNICDTSNYRMVFSVRPETITLI